MAAVFAVPDEVQAAGPGGAQLVADVNPGTPSSSPDGFVTYDGATYFSATDTVHGTELWRSDGTTAGSAVLRDLAPGQARALPSS